MIVKAGCVIFKSPDKLDEILNIRIEYDNKNFWSLPKGHKEPNETILECAIRETEEEIGVKPIILSKKAFRMRLKTMEVYWFPAVVKDFNFKPQTEENIVEIKFRSLVDTLKDNVWYIAVAGVIHHCIG